MILATRPWVAWILWFFQSIYRFPLSYQRNPVALYTYA